MNIARFFIDRPVFAIVISLVMVIAGLLSLLTLPVTQYPEIVPPTVTVSTSYPGADANTVAQTVGIPIEEQVNGVEKMLYMSSQSSSDGSYKLTVTFQLGTNLDIAQVQVQNRVQIAQAQLPEDVKRQGIKVQKASPDITLIVALYSPKGTYDKLYLSNYAYLQIQDQITRLPGVGSISIFGERDYSMRVWLNPDQLAYRNLTAGDVAAALREQNVQVAAGMVGAQPLPKGEAAFQLTVSALGRLTDPEQFGEVVIKSGKDGSITHLRDVARIELGGLDYSSNTYYNGQPAVGIGVFQLPGTNSLNTADAVYAKMEELKKNFPADVEYAIPYNTTIFVRESIKDVVKTLFEAVLLVVIVVIVFLQSWRASIIPLMAIPVSLIGTFAIMKVMGFSLNNLSLFGIVLAIGIVVDDAIVVVENVQRWLEKGLSPPEAARKAMDEVTGAVIAIAFGLSAVFIPTAFISGISGQFYRQFALTIAVATLFSAFNSLTLSPAMAALILRPEHAKPDWFQWIINILFGWFFKSFNKILSWLTIGYAGSLRWVVRLSVIMLMLYVGFLAMTYIGFKRVPTGFIPQQDTGYLVGSVQLPDAAAADRSDAAVFKLGEMARTIPGIQNTFVISGYSLLTSAAQSNTGSMFLVLEPFDERVGDPEKSLNAVYLKLTQKFSQEQDGLAVAFPPPPVSGMSNAGGFKFMVEDQTGTHTPAELQAAVNAVIDEGRKRPELTGLFTTFSATVPQLYVNVDREKLKTQDVSLTSVFDTLQIYMGSLYVNDFNYLNRTYHVTAQADASYRAKAEDIKQLQTRNNTGGMVPLGAILDVQDTVGPTRISRYNLYPSAEINGAAMPGVASGTAIEIMQELADANLPPGFGYEWTDLTYQEIAAGNTALFIFPLCVLFVWLTHSAEYESFALSTAIILIVPMCLFAAIYAVDLQNMDNNIFTQIGFVVLIGLAAKNAVLIIEFAKQQQEEKGKGSRDAAIEAAHLRLRPILMTSLAFILGVLPMLTAVGAGAEMRHAIGVAVFYGMIGVTVFGLFMTPVFYVVIRWLTGKTEPLGEVKEEN